MATATKKKRTVAPRSTKIVTPVSDQPKRIPFGGVPNMVAAMPIGWSPRITRYFKTGDKELATYLAAKEFSPQTLDGEFEVGGWYVKEVGAYLEIIVGGSTTARQETSYRIVQVSENPTEPTRLR